MDTQAIIAICGASLFGLFMILSAIRDMLEKGRQYRINLATQRTETARAEADREEAVARGKDADATAETQRTEQARLDATRRGELIKLGRLEAEAAHASANVTPLPRSGTSKV